MARPKSIPIRAELVKLFPAARLRGLAKRAGAVVRERKVNPVTLFWSVILGFGSGRERNLAGLRRAYERSSGQRIEESSFYNRFNAGLAKMFRLVFAEAMQSMSQGRKQLTGTLAAFVDVLITDSTTIRLHDLLAPVFAGCRTNHSKAALKLHPIFSVKTAGCQSIKVTSGRRHDGPVLRVGPWVRGRLFLFDLGYFCYQLFACISQNGGYFLTRLKGCANPVIVQNNLRCRGRSKAVVGKRIKDVVKGMKRGVLDVMVEVSFPRRRYAGRARHDTIILRVIAVRDAVSGKYHLYITNVPSAKLTAHDVSAVYALRWEIELLFKELKRHYRLEDLPSRNRHVVEILIYAALIVLVVSRKLLELVAAKLGPSGFGRLPKHRWAALLATVAQDLLVLVVRPPRQTKMMQRLVAELLLAESIDPKKNRPPLQLAVETQRHAYRLRAA